MAAGTQRTLAVAVNLLLDAAAVEVVGALRAADVQSILLKGPPLVRWLYGSEAARHSVDVDILVSPAALAAAERALAGLGFGRLATGTGQADRPRHASTWRSPRHAPSIDLHTRLVGIELPATEAWRILAAEVESIRVCEARIDVLSPAARTLHVVLHAAQHGSGEPQPLEDLARALATLPAEVWDEAAELAAKLQAAPAFAMGLALLPQGREVVARLGLETGTTVEAALRAHTAPALSLGLEWLARAPGLWAKTRFVARKLVPPPAFMRTWSGLARGGRGRLLLAYAWRPLWLLLRLGPALRAWHAAYKATRRS